MAWHWVLIVFTCNSLTYNKCMMACWANSLYVCITRGNLQLKLNGMNMRLLCVCWENHEMTTIKRTQFIHILHSFQYCLYVKWFTHCHLHTIYQSDAMERTDVVNLHITKTIVCLGHFVSIVLKRDPKRSSWKVWPMAKLGVKNLILDIRTHAPREKQLIEHKILQLEVDGPLSRCTDTITSHKAQSWRCSLDLSHC